LSQYPPCLGRGRTEPPARSPPHPAPPLTGGSIHHHTSSCFQ
jgi:hypothetical protein